MAILRVVFPHTSAEGERFFAGDLRELPDHQVEEALRPDLDAGFPVMAVDPVIWQPAIDPGVPQGPPALIEELFEASLAAAPVESLPVEEALHEEPAADEAEKPAKRGRR